MDYVHLFTSYLKTHKNASQATIKNYKADISQFIRWYEARSRSVFVPLSITPNTIEAYILYKNKHDLSDKSLALSQKSINRHLSSLRSFFAFLKETQIIEKNPLLNSTVPTSQTRDTYHKGEFKNFLFQVKLSKLTIKNYLNDIYQFLNWLQTTLGVTEAEALNSLTSRIIVEYKSRLLKPLSEGGKGLSVKSVNRKLSSLRLYTKWLQDKEYLRSEVLELPAASLPIGNQPIFEAISSTLVATDKPFEQEEEPQEIKEEITMESSLIIADEKNTDSLPPTLPYSRFAPLRLLQKTKGFGEVLLNTLVFDPLITLTDNLEYSVWKAMGKPVFRKITPEELSLLTNNRVKKETRPFYAPIVQAAQFPFHKKIIHHIRHTRPKWYIRYHSYSVFHYFHFAALILFIAILSFFFYSVFVLDPQLSKPAFASDSTYRVLSFQGKLIDNNNNPINKPSRVRMAMYTDEVASGSALVWEETDIVTPALDGSFSILLGNRSTGGTPIAQKIFTNNPALWLGISIEDSEELKPRQPLATTVYAQDAKRVDGLLPITGANAGTKNVLLALDSSGNLTIGNNASPTFEATGGQFTLSGKSLLLTTAVDSNTDVQIAPDGFGKIDLQKPLHNSTNRIDEYGSSGRVEIADMLSITATASAQSAFTINQTSTGGLISTSVGGIAKFTVDNDGTGFFAGNIGIGTSSPTSRLEVLGDIKAVSTSDARVLIERGNASASATLQFSTAGYSKWQLGLLPGHNLDSFSISRTNGTNIPLFINGSGMVGIGTTAPGGTLSVHGGVSVGSYSGTKPPDNGIIASGNVGVGTNNPHFQFSALRSIQNDVTASITNTNNVDSSTNGALRLGIGTAKTGTSSRFIQFYAEANDDNNGTGVGNIRLNNGGVAYTSGNADFAEYFAMTESSEPGDVIAVTSSGNKKASKGTSVLGVVSDTAGFIGNAKDAKLTNQTVVGLLGQIKTKVSTENGIIIPGDYLTPSSTPGVAMKATTAGIVIGKALEAFTTDGIGKILVYVHAEWHDPDVYITETGNLSIQPRTQGSEQTPSFSLQNEAGKIITRIGAFGELLVAKIKAGSIVAETITTKSLIALQANITTLTSEKIVSPIAEIDRIRTNVISPLSSDSVVIDGKLLVRSLSNTAFEIQNASGSAVFAVTNEGNASLSGTLQAKNLESNSASISGTLRAGRIIADEIEGLQNYATESAQYITNINNIYQSTPSAGIISPLASSSALLISLNELNAASFSGQLIPADSLKNAFANLDSYETNFAQFKSGLVSLGPSSFADVSIAGNLSLGSGSGGLMLAQNSLNVIGNSLEIQPLRQGMISFMGGLVTIDTDGNLKVTGNAEFGKDLSVIGNLSAQIISPLPNSNITFKLSGNQASDSAQLVVQNASGSAVLSVSEKGDVIASGSAHFAEVIANSLQIVRQAQADTSLKETIASSSAGIATIVTGETERTIINPLIKETSLIYISPTSDTQGQAPYIARQTVESKEKNQKGSFTIQIPSRLQKEITLNWWIVN